MKIGIIGTGDVGRALGKGFLGLGYEVKIGSRDGKNEKAKTWAAESGDKATTGTFAEAAEFAEVAVLSTLWTGTENAIRLAKPENLAEKIVIDTTKPLDFSKGMPPGLALGHTDSGGEQIQRWLPGSKVVKCFNIVGNAHMVNPDFPCGPPDMFFCGNDADAKEIVGKILIDFGWNGGIDIGNIGGSRLLEPMCILWVIFGSKTGGWNHAFKMLKK